MKADSLWRIEDLLHSNVGIIVMTGSTMIVALVQGQETDDTAHLQEDDLHHMVKQKIDYGSLR